MATDAVAVSAASGPTRPYARSWLDLATERVDALDRTISALRHEREILAMPTWPWSSGTIRGFGSALLLPIALFLAQRALSAALGD